MARCNWSRPLAAYMLILNVVAIRTASSLGLTLSYVRLGLGYIFSVKFMNELK